MQRFLKHLCKTKLTQRLTHWLTQERATLHHFSIYNHHFYLNNRIWLRNTKKMCNLRYLNGLFTPVHHLNTSKSQQGQTVKVLWIIYLQCRGKHNSIQMVNRKGKTKIEKQYYCCASYKQPKHPTSLTEKAKQTKNKPSLLHIFLHFWWARIQHDINSKVI